MKQRLQKVGYTALREEFNVICLPHFVESYVHHGARKTETTPELSREYYYDSYWPGDHFFDHLEFALKREGLSLALLRRVLPQIPKKEVERFVSEKPTGQYRRHVWYLYENLTGEKLDLPDLTMGNYADLLDPIEYYTGTPQRSQRHRVNDNLPGTVAFSPLVRRTAALKKFEDRNLEQACSRMLREVPPEIYARALDYLYSKETRSSYAIEHETPDQKRANKFVEALRNAPRNDYMQEEALVTLQKTIVDPRFANDSWRREQNYVGQSLAAGREKIHFISPRPEDLAGLMQDYLAASRRILQSEIHPVIAATMIAYPFVFLHPFTDGNGRTHRFLIHYVLSRRGFAPEGVVFPVSAIMLNRMREYDRSLESFSKPLVPLVDFEMDPEGRLSVQNETADFYRYIDCTFIAETLFSFIQETIEKELPAEVKFIQNYDTARHRMREVVDLPNRHADLFIRFCRQNEGRFPKSRRKDMEYRSLTEPEIKGLEEVVREAFSIGEGIDK